MDALILSCSTGGGHNSAGYAVMEELIRRGHNATMLDPYSLIGKNVDKKVGDCYIGIAQRTPHLFGALYGVANQYRKLPIHSPVYSVNKIMLKTMQEYLEKNSFDVIFMPHVFPAEILTYMKKKGVKIPKTVFISTDYTCIPFTEETDCDYYIVPAFELLDEFEMRGISKEKLKPFGIPVKKAFSSQLSRSEALETLGLNSDKKYILLSGGSIGAGQIEKCIKTISRFMTENSEVYLIAICGNNKRLFDKLNKLYGDSENITLITSTDKIACYMKACSVYISKPGGLSSTESAVIGVPLIHVSPIPGCESLNLKFFNERKMSIAVKNCEEDLISALNSLRNEQLVAEMLENQKKYINQFACADICDFAEKII
ncbi:MAG: glycosyltransferase [Christensenellaceae bacterium]